MGGLTETKLCEPLADWSALTCDVNGHERSDAFLATAELFEHSAGLRKAPVLELSSYGCYLAMLHPFSKGASLLLKIRTETEFFQCPATVVHSTFGIGMGVEFREVSPRFLTVLQGWLLRFPSQQRYPQI